MRDIVIERCKKVLDHWNVVLCHNYKNIKFHMDKLVDVQEDGFEVYLYVVPFGIRPTICKVEEIPENPALVEIFVNENLLYELGLEYDEPMICDSSLVHIILESIFSTSYVSDVVYNQIKEMIFND